jgi:hypothetical protein
LPPPPEAFLRLIAPYREDIGGGGEGMFTWYWVADLCAKEGIPFVLGHALSRKAIPGGKAKALTVLAHKLGRAVYDMLSREQAFDLTRFVTA